MSDSSKEEISGKVDANDYSKFDKIDDVDEEDLKTDEAPAVSPAEVLSCANALKDAGNESFKKGDYAAAMSSYDMGIETLSKHRDLSEAQALLISLYSNNAMVQLKLEDYTKAASSASEVLSIEPANVKALFRRGVANHNLGKLDEAKFDLACTLDNDPQNGAAAKELAEVVKKMKELKLKEKAAFSGMFKKSMYEDREKERQDKLKREEEEKQRLQDEWTQSKLVRRDKGLEEQTFDDWKKERDEAEKKKTEQENKGSSSSSTKSTSSTAASKATKTKKESTGDGNINDANDDDDEMEASYDEEEAKIIAETKAKGYCYFRNQQCKYLSLY
jgi:tetratricopeptide (TPR) repeat protein